MKYLIVLKTPGEHLIMLGITGKLLRCNGKEKVEELEPFKSAKASMTPDLFAGSRNVSYYAVESPEDDSVSKVSELIEPGLIVKVILNNGTTLCASKISSEIMRRNHYDILADLRAKELRERVRAGFVTPPSAIMPGPDGFILN